MGLNDEAEKVRQAWDWLATEPFESVKHQAAVEHLVHVGELQIRSTPPEYSDCATVTDRRGKQWKYDDCTDTWSVITGSLGPGSVGGPDWSCRSWQRLQYEFGPLA